MAQKSKKSAAKKAAKTASTKKAATKKTPAKKAVAKKVAAKKTTVKKVAAKKVATKKTVAKKAAKKKATPKLTTITASIDVGFGNSLYLRGEGGGLSWDSGTLMANASSDSWVWSTSSAKGTVEFKVLINDEIWSAGANESVAAGSRIEVAPSF